MTCLLARFYAGIFIAVATWAQVLLGIIAACLRGYYGSELFDSPREELGGRTYGMVLIGASLSGVLITALKQL